jgi:hypothetical protein
VPILRIGCGHGFRRLGTLGEIDFAPEYGIIFYRKAQRTHIAFHNAPGAQFQPAGGHNVALDLSLDQDVACR